MANALRSCAQASRATTCSTHWDRRERLDLLRRQRGSGEANFRLGRPSPTLASLLPYAAVLFYPYTYHNDRLWPCTSDAPTCSGWRICARAQTIRCLMGQERPGDGDTFGTCSLGTRRKPRPALATWLNTAAQAKTCLFMNGHEIMMDEGNLTSFQFRYTGAYIEHAVAASPASTTPNCSHAAT